MSAQATDATATVLETPDRRRSRLTLGILIIVVAAALLLAGFGAHGTARFALSDSFAEAQLPTLVLPGMATTLLCALLAGAAGVIYVVRSWHARLASWAGVVAGLAVVLGFLAWAAAGSALPFAVANQLAGTLTLATPLVFGALAGVLCERAGVVNVAIEGQMLTAALTAAVVGSATKSVLAALLAAVAVGVAMAALLAVFAIRYFVDQVVLGVVLNLFATGLTGFIFDQLVKPNRALNNAPTMQPVAVPLLSKIPLIGPVLFNQTVLAYLAVASVVIVWAVLFRTTWGLRIRAVGEHPHAADTVGINVGLTRWSAVLFGGVFAGLGGAFFTIGSTGSFSKSITVGNGFIALAALIMGRWHPVWAAIMAVFFGFVTQLGSQVQALQTPLPSQFLLMLPYVATIIAVAGLVGKVRAPKADGIAFRKEEH